MSNELLSNNEYYFISRKRPINDHSKTRPTTLGRDPSCARGKIAILRLLSRSDKPLGVSAIARELRIFPSTCLHILHALGHEECVAVAAATQYCVDAGVLSIARHFLTR